MSCHLRNSYLQELLRWDLQIVRRSHFFMLRWPVDWWGVNVLNLKILPQKINLWVLNSPKCMGLWNHLKPNHLKKPLWGLTWGLRNLKKPFNEGGNVRQGLSCFISSNFPRWKWKHKLLKIKLCVLLEHLFFSVFRCFRISNNSSKTTLSHFCVVCSSFTRLWQQFQLEMWIGLITTYWNSTGEEKHCLIQ